MFEVALIPIILKQSRVGNFCWLSNTAKVEKFARITVNDFEASTGSTVQRNLRLIPSRNTVNDNCIF